MINGYIKFNFENFHLEYRADDIYLRRPKGEMRELMQT